jgi:hypothetical protein
MALIPQDELTTLKSATEVKSVASTAELDQETNTVAYYINSAANTGNTQVLINHKLSESLANTLKSKGYILTYNKYIADPSAEVTISWDIPSNG